MNDANWSLSADNGDLLLLTGVTGRAAKMGHRLTMAMQSWRASLDWKGGVPTHAELAVDVDSLEVIKGEGGVTPLGGPEKGIARNNALKSLDAKKFPQIRFSSDEIAKTGSGYRMTGTVEIHGTSRPQVVDLNVEQTGDTWKLATQVRITQTDFGVKLISLFMGSMKVADEVVIDFHATYPK
ncbi:MAG: YceI family protein [Mycobacterium sp.]|nr:YceI family protein [Mycobacterium sp.]